MPVSNYNLQKKASIDSIQDSLKASEHISSSSELRMREQLKVRAKERLRQTTDEVNSGSLLSNAAVSKDLSPEEQIQESSRNAPDSMLFSRQGSESLRRRSSAKASDKTNTTKLPAVPIAGGKSVSFQEDGDIALRKPISCPPLPLRPIVSPLRSAPTRLEPIGESGESVPAKPVNDSFSSDDHADNNVRESAITLPNLNVPISPPTPPKSSPERRRTKSPLTKTLKSLEVNASSTETTPAIHRSGSSSLKAQPLPEAPPPAEEPSRPFNPTCSVVELSADVAVVAESPSLQPEQPFKSARIVAQERWAKSEAERAIKNRKIFTVMGPYPTLRDSLRKRGWVEKFPSNDRSPTTRNLTCKPIEECINANKKFYIDASVYRMMSNVVRNVTPTLLFTVKAVDVGSKVTKQSQLVNHFGRASTFTTKSGLCHNLRSVPWFNNIDPQTFYPRCYSLELMEDREAFIDDYRMMACMGFLKHFVSKYDAFIKGMMGGVAGGRRQGGGAGGGHRGISELVYELNINSSAGSQLLKTTDITDIVAANRVQRPSAGLTAYGSLPTNPGDPPIIGSAGPPLLPPASDPAAEGGAVQKLKPRQLSSKALTLSMKRCRLFLAELRHEDIDDDGPDTVTDTMWEQFLAAYHQFVSNELDIDRKALKEMKACKEIVKQLEARWPQFRLDGCRDVWILKPGAKSRGRGIQCANRLSVILEAVASSECILVAQKYIERPMLIYRTKFDIRQWFLVTDWNPLTMWFYNDCYLRFCSQEFTLNDFHVSIHLSNNSVQKYFTPDSQRSDKLPHDNMWTSDEFIDYLQYTNGYGDCWNTKIVPGMKQAILCTLLCTQEQVEHRKSAFELFGADFMLTEDLHPWLIEINSSPSMARDTRATGLLVNAVLEDTIKVVLDRKENVNCDIGRFELAYVQDVVSTPNPIDSLITIQGKKVAKRYRTPSYIV